MSIIVRAGENIPLNVVLDDGATDKFVRAFLYDDANNPLPGTPVNLSHVAEGLYRNSSIPASLLHKRVFAVYEVFDDAGFQWPAYEYDLRTEDVFDISVEGSRSSYQLAVPPMMELPFVGTKTYRFVVYTFDDAGVPADVDNQQVFVHIEDAFNSIILPDTACQREQIGVYFYRYTVSATDVERPLWVAFRFMRGGVPIFVGQVSEVIKTDARTTSLDTVKLTADRANNLDLIDVAVSSRQSAAAGLSQYNTLRGDIASVGVGVSAVDTKLGTPSSGSVSGDVAITISQTSKIGSPTNGTLAADHAAILALLAKIGLPATGTLAGDLAALDAHLSAQDGSLAGITSQVVKIGVPPSGTLGASQQTILDAIDSNQDAETQTQGMLISLSAKIGMPSNGTVSADIASIKGDTSTLRTRLTEQRASNLDNLDVAISTRESEADASTRYNALFSTLQSVLASVGAIPNNTTFVGIVPPVLVLPDVGVKTYKFFANLFDQQGLPQDPDGAMAIVAEDSLGNLVLAQQSMTRVDVGQFEILFPVAWNDPERILFVSFVYAQNGVPYRQTRIAEVQEFESKLDLLLQRITQTRAANLDRLDVAVSSRYSATAGLGDFTDLSTLIQQVIVEAQTIEALLGTPVVSLASDLASIRSWVAKIGNPTTTLAGDIALARAENSSAFSQVITDLLLILQRVAELKLDVGLVRADTSHIGLPAGGTVAAALGDLRAKLGASGTSIESLINGLSFGSLLAILGIPVSGTIAGDIAGVNSRLISTQTTLGTVAGIATQIPGIAAGVGALGTAVAPIMPKLTLIESKIDTLEVAVDLAPIEVKIDALQEDVDSIDNRTQQIPTNPVLASDPRLDHLDADVSSRATPADVSGGSAGGFMALDIAGIIDADEGSLVGFFEEEPTGELSGALDGHDEIFGILEDDE